MKLVSLNRPLKRPTPANRSRLITCGILWAFSFFPATGNAGTLGFIANSSLKKSTQDVQNCDSSATVIKLKYIPNVYLLESVKPASSSKTSNCLNRFGRTVSPLTYHLESIKASGGDPEISSQWHINYSRGVDAQIMRGWAFTQQNPSPATHAVDVAVIDTGIDLTHPDLMDAISVNQKEIPGNGIDDDGNGYIDDVKGWSFQENSNQPQDDHGHGTHVSGIIAATRNNGIGVSGISSEARVVPIRAFNAAGDADAAVLVKSIDYAIGRGVKIINASWGQYEADPLLAEAVRQAASLGILFVAAAGNDSTNTDAKPHYPSAYPFDGVLAVGASESNGNSAAFSNFGQETVHVFAPGSNIFSTMLGGRYGSMSGTSMASPVVAGLAASVWARDPSLTALQVKSSIIQAAALASRKIPSLSTKCLAGGIVSLVASLGGDPGQTYDHLPPEPVGDLVAVSPGHFEATLSWSPATDDLGLDHYLITRDGGTAVETKSCFYRDSTTLGGTRYHYEVSSVDWAGNVSTPQSAGVETPAFGQSGAWSAFSANVETPHPYPASAHLSYELGAPAGFRASKLRLHFSKFNTEESFDTLKIFNAEGGLVDTYQGELNEFTSTEIAGDRARIEFTSDPRNNRWGFLVNRIEVLLE